MSKVFIISAPSGTGKTSLNSKLTKDYQLVEVSVSLTSRAQRPAEIPGISYDFVTPEQFEHYIKSGDMLEYANVFGNFYGTRKSDVNRIQNLGKHVILEIDVEGCKSVKKLLPESQSLFIFPPSLDVTWKRLAQRGTDSLETRARRLKAARDEIDQSLIFDYFILNSDFDQAYIELKNLVFNNAPPKFSREQAAALREKLLFEYQNLNLDEWIKVERQTQ